MANLKTADAAKYLCVSHSKLMKMCANKEIKYYKVGRINVFKEEDLLSYLDSNRVVTIDDLKQMADNAALKKSSYG